MAVVVLALSGDKVDSRFNELQEEIIFRPTFRTLELFAGEVRTMNGEVDLRNQRNTSSSRVTLSIDQ